MRKRPAVRVLAELRAARPRTRATGQGRKYRPHHRCGRGEPAGAVARSLGRLAHAAFAQRLERPRPCRAGLCEARLPGPRVARQLAQDTNRVLPVRLVKGAYWDTEIKRSQEAGYEGYPLFTRKVSTDVSYLACARYLLDRRDVFFPQFATHNAHTLAAVTVMAGNDRRYEFQRLHGMGQQLYASVVARRGASACRIYAPVGSHEDLLAYLVRRLLENGANTLVRQSARR